MNYIDMINKLRVLIDKIETKYFDYELNLTIDNDFHLSCIGFFEDSGYLTEKQLKALTKFGHRGKLEYKTHYDWDFSNIDNC